jgi:ribosome-associated translation inhibitor RaiA
MAKVIRKSSPMAQYLADAINDLKAQIGAGAFFHLDKCELSVTVADATDLPTALLLCQNIQAIWAFHGLDTLAHKVADGVDVTVAPIPTDLATAITWANEFKADYNLHIASTTYHYNADATNAVAAANATILSDLLTLINQEKSKLNAHIVSGQPAKSLRVVAA